jgi:hypothetical protein
VTLLSAVALPQPMGSPTMLCSMPYIQCVGRIASVSLVGGGGPARTLFICGGTNFQESWMPFSVNFLGNDWYPATYVSPTQFIVAGDWSTLSAGSISLRVG